MSKKKGRSQAKKKSVRRHPARSKLRVKKVAAPVGQKKRILPAKQSLARPYQKSIWVFISTRWKTIRPAIWKPAHALFATAWPWVSRAGILGLPLFCLLLQIPWLRRNFEPAPQTLALAYPQAIQRVIYTLRGWKFILKGGEEVPFADGKVWPFDLRVECTDLQSVLSQPYPFGRIRLPMPEGQEAGRLRCYALLQAVYGAGREEVQKNLEPVNFLGDRVFFNRQNGAAAALQQVAREIEMRPALLAYLKPIAAIHERQNRSLAADGLHTGTYISGWNWRLVAGTARLSPHSFGIAIDIYNPFARQPKYWRWQKPTLIEPGSAEYIDSMPWELVEIFERHGFIWGGKWHHFDTVHFEYRPEFLLAQGGFSSSQPQSVQPGGDNFYCSQSGKNRK